MSDDLISRSALLEYGNARTIKEAVGNWDELDGKAKAAILRYAIKLKSVINHAPAVDAVPVVRCKDCEYYEAEECGNPYIFMSDGAHMYTGANDFCSYGERKGDG